MELTEPTVGQPFLPFPWNQGDHIILTGRTGTGKSNMLRHLLIFRSHWLIIRTKKDKVIYPADLKVTTAKQVIRALRNQRVNRVELAPVLSGSLASSSPAQRKAAAETIYAGLNECYHQNNWCVAIDEGFYLDRLGLRPAMEELQTQGRSLGLTVITGVQRPVHISRFMASESSHIISFAAEGRDSFTLKDAFGRKHAEAVEQLQRYEMAWTDINNHQIWIGKLQDLNGKVD